MTRDHQPDLIDADRFSVRELRDAVLKRKGTIDRSLALSLLRAKSYPQKVQDLSGLLMDEGEEPRVRNLAAQLLGDARTPSGTRALLQGLDIKDELTLRGVVQGLVSTGDPEAITALRPLARRKGPVGVAATRALAPMGNTSRAERRGPSLDPPPAAPEAPQGEGSTSITIAPAPDEEIGQAIQQLEGKFPTLTLDHDRAIAIRRGPRAFFFLPNRDAAADLSALAERSAHLGIVAAPREVEAPGWEAKFHILTEPEGGGGFRIAVTSAGGRHLFAGRGQVNAQGSIDFDVTSVERPGATQVMVRGAYDGRTVRIDTADVQSRAAAAGAVPQRMGERREAASGTPPGPSQPPARGALRTQSAGITGTRG